MNEVSVSSLSFQLGALIPYLIVAGGGLLVMLFDAFVKTLRKDHLLSLTMILILAAIIAQIVQQNTAGPVLGGMLLSQGYAEYFNYLLLGIGLMTAVFATSAFHRDSRYRAEFYPLLLFSLVGMMVLVAASDLMSLFLGLETMSLAVYVLVGGRKGYVRSSEAGFKYLILGGFSSAFLLMGMALIYGFAGGTSYAVISAAMAAQQVDLLVSIGAGLMLIGFGFKIALVPFHMWTPDVYDGAPAYITGFMATAVKAAGVAALVRFAWLLQPALATIWFPLLSVLAVLTMSAGNLIALMQNNIKRMLAYSSIAHAGYLTLGVLALLAPGRGDPSVMIRGQNIGEAAGGGILFYLFGYSLMNLAAFGVINVLGKARANDADRIDGYAGLSRRQPLAALVLAVAMLSLAGIPPTVGFMGKFYIFDAVVRAGLVPLAVFGVINSLVSVYYYLRVIVVMYMKPAEDDAYDGRNWETLVAAVGLTVLALVFGVWPPRLFQIAVENFKTMAF